MFQYWTALQKQPELAIAFDTVSAKAWIEQSDNFLFAVADFGKKV